MNRMGRGSRLVGCGWVAVAVAVCWCATAHAQAPRGFVGDTGSGWDTTSEVTAMHSSSWASREGVHCVDGSAISADGLYHGNVTVPYMWLGNNAGPYVSPSGLTGNQWIQWEFARAYVLTNMWIWNMNEGGGWSIMGVKDATLQTSLDGNSWSTFGAIQIPKASGSASEPANLQLDMNDTLARFVLLTTANGANANWGHPTTEAGLAEVRFYGDLASAPRGFIGDTGSGWNSGAGGVVATASSEVSQRWAGHTVDGSGVTADGYAHTNAPLDHMWLTADTGPHTSPGGLTGHQWIQWNFDRPYAVTNMWVWNWNETAWLVFGVKDATLQTSLDGVHWSTFGPVQIPKSSGAQLGPVDLVLDLGNILARYVLLTTANDANANWGYASTQVGLSEARFYADSGAAPRGFIGDTGSGWDTSSSVSVTASDQKAPDRLAAHTVDGSGLTADGLTHTNWPFGNMWLCNDSGPHTSPSGLEGYQWIHWEFDGIYPLGEMWVWNWNENAYPQFGIKDATIQTSLDGTTWTTFGPVQIPRRDDGLKGPVSLALPMNNVRARHVLLTTANNADANWGWASTELGLCEVRFYPGVVEDTGTLIILH